MKKSKAFLFSALSCLGVISANASLVVKCPTSMTCKNQYITSCSASNTQEGMWHISGGGTIFRGTYNFSRAYISGFPKGIATCNYTLPGTDYSIGVESAQLLAPNMKSANNWQIALLPYFRCASNNLAACQFIVPLL